MKAITLTALLIMGSIAPAAAESLDLTDYYPGRLALTHTLRATDGRHYSFTGDVTSGVWSRSIDPGWADHAVWTPEGMYYLGFTDPTGIHWTVPELGLPRHWDPAVPWHKTYTATTTHRSATRSWMTHESVIITLETVTVAGEVLYLLRAVIDPHVADDPWWATAEEHWYLSTCIPINGGGCAPGFRGFVLWADGVVVGSAEFVEWVPRVP